MKTLNLSSLVRIKLTPYGIEKLKRVHAELRSHFPDVGDFTPSETDKDGYCEMLLWDVMNTFGEDVYHGSVNMPFEADIQIDDAEFKESEN